MSADIPKTRKVAVCVLNIYEASCLTDLNLFYVAVVFQAEGKGALVVDDP